MNPPVSLWFVPMHLNFQMYTNNCHSGSITGETLQHLVSTIYVLCKLYDKASAHHIVAYLSCQLVRSSTMPTMISWSTRSLRTIFPHSLQIPTLSRMSLVIGFLLVAAVLPCHHFLTMISIIWTRILYWHFLLCPLRHILTTLSIRTSLPAITLISWTRSSTRYIRWVCLAWTWPCFLLLQNARICAIQPEQGSSKLHITLVWLQCIIV